LRYTNTKHKIFNLGLPIFPPTRPKKPEPEKKNLDDLLTYVANMDRVFGDDDPHFSDSAGHFL